MGTTQVPAFFLSCRQIEAHTRCGLRAVLSTAYNKPFLYLWLDTLHGIVPVGIKKDIKDLIDGVYHIEQDPKKRLANARVDRMNEKQLAQEIKRLEKEMMAAARDLDFERAAQARDELKALKQRIFINGE